MKDISKLVQAINKKLGAELVQPASKTVDRKIVKRPTGITSLDLALGGGFPSTTINVISGQEGVGKDALLNQIIKMHQWIYGDDASVFYGHSESGYDKIWARKHGVKIPLSDEDIATYERATKRKFDAAFRAKLKEEVGTFLLAEHNNAEGMYDAILEYVRAGACHLYVVNSVNALHPDEFIDEDIGEGNKGAGMRSAAVVTEFCKKFLNAARSTSSSVCPTLLMVNQARANIEGARGWGSRHWTTKTGAYALRHFKVVDVVLQNIGKIRSGSEVIGKEIKWEIEKGKYGTHDGLSGKFNLFFSTGPDYASDLLDTLLNLKFLEVSDAKKGGQVSIHDHDGEVVLEGNRAEVAEKIRADHKLFLRLYKIALSTLRVPYLWRYEDLPDLS